MTNDESSSIVPVVSIVPAVPCSLALQTSMIASQKEALLRMGLPLSFVVNMEFAPVDITRSVSSVGEQDLFEAITYVKVTPQTIMLMFEAGEDTLVKQEMAKMPGIIADDNLNVVAFTNCSPRILARVQWNGRNSLVFEAIKSDDESKAVFNMGVADIILNGLGEIMTPEAKADFKFHALGQFINSLGTSRPLALPENGVSR